MSSVTCRSRGPAEQDQPAAVRTGSADVAPPSATAGYCTAANRVLAQRGVADVFARRLADRVAALPMGRGTEPNVVVGPLIDAH
ncbi:aldehyde dehydrogenase family protein [Nocardia sp. Marseille-Q1738]